MGNNDGQYVLILTREQLNTIIQEEVSKIRLSRESELLSVRDAGKELNVSRATIHRLRKEGKLKPVFIGRSIKFNRSNVESLKKNG